MARLNWTQNTPDRWTASVDPDARPGRRVVLSVMQIAGGWMTELAWPAFGLQAETPEAAQEEAERIQLEQIRSILRGEQAREQPISAWLRNLADEIDSGNVEGEDIAQSIGREGGYDITCPLSEAGGGAGQALIDSFPGGLS